MCLTSIFKPAARDAILTENMALAGLPFPAFSAITALPAFMFLVSGARPVSLRR